VTDPESALTIRRILVALDASAQSLAAVDAAVELAARLEAELLGLFVEDVELLRLAESPYACEILYASAKEAPLSRATMESRLRAQCEQARKALGAAAERLQVPWSFRSVRGKVTPEILAAAAEADLLALGKIGWSFGPLVRMGSTALEAAASAMPVLLVSEQGLPHEARLVVYYDGSAASKRSLLAASQLASPDTHAITVLLAPHELGRTAAMRDEVASALEGKDLEVRFREIDPQNETSLCRALKAEPPGTLVLGGRELLKKLQAAGVSQREIEVPLLLLANGESTEAEQKPEREVQ
jgi:nucleotide-binding universal stress UspA family protein